MQTLPDRCGANVRYAVCLKVMYLIYVGCFQVFEAWPPSAETLASWSHLEAPEEKKRSRKPKVIFTTEQIDSAVDSVHGFKKVLRPRVTGKHAGKNDVFYVSKTSGHICRSVADIERHLNLPVTRVRKTRAKPEREVVPATPAPALFQAAADKTAADAALDEELMKLFDDSETEDDLPRKKQNTRVA